VRYAEPIDWNGEPVRFAVGIAGLNNEHLEILSKIAIVFSDEDEVQKLIDAGSADEIYALLEEVNAE
jgi:PTS system mannitol-specific IIA component